MTIHVVTDSACDLTEEAAHQLGVAVIPLAIRFGEEEVLDRVDLTPDQFYARLASSRQLPETAAPAPGAFETAFRAAAAAGAEAVVCINMSSGLSASIESARAAMRAVGDELDVRVLDSRSVSWGLGSQVVAAARAGLGGATVDEVTAVVEEMAPRTRVYAALDTLDNLKKGGRIGGARAMVGSLLSIKPVIVVRTGVVEEAGKPRTRRKALRYLADVVAGYGTVENLAVMHGGAPDVEDLLDLLGERYPKDRIHVGQIGATIGTHAGPRVMGVTFQAEPGTVAGA